MEKVGGNGGNGGNLTKTPKKGVENFDFGDGAVELIEK